MVYIGVDNGVSGTIGIYGDSVIEVYKVPVRKGCSDYSANHSITRVDVDSLRGIMCRYTGGDVKVILEYPYFNMKNIRTTFVAGRCLEAELIVLEGLGLEYSFVSARVWQSDLFPGIRGRLELKRRSLMFGIDKLGGKVSGFSDFDGLCIAYWGFKNRV